MKFCFYNFFLFNLCFSSVSFDTWVVKKMKIFFFIVKRFLESGSADTCTDRVRICLMQGAPFGGNKTGSGWVISYRNDSLAVRNHEKHSL